MSYLSIDATNHNIPALSLTSLGHFINDGSVFFFPVIADILVEDRTFSAFYISLLYLLFYLTATLFSFLVGGIANRYGHQGILISAGLILMGIGFLGFFPVVSGSGGVLGLALAALASVSYGAGSAFYHPMGAAIIQNRFRKNEVGKVLGMNGSAGSVGRALYPSLLFVIAAILSISYSLIVFAIFAIIAAVIIGIGLHDSIINTSGTATGEKRVSAREALTASVLLLGIITFVKTFASYGIVSWIPVYVSNIKGLGLTVSLGYVLTSMFIAAIIGQPIFGILADRYDKRYVMALSSIGTAVSISLYLVTGGALGIVFLIIFGFFTFSAFPLLFALISEYVSRGGSSMANAFVWGFGNQAGMALGPFFVGILIFNAYSHLAFMFYIMAILVVVSAALLMLLPKPKKKVQMPLF